MVFFVKLLEMFSECFVALFFSQSHHPRLQFLPVRDYIGTNTVIYDIKVYKPFFNQETCLFKKGDHLIRIIAYFETSFSFSLILLIIFKLKLFFNPPKRLAKSIVLCPFEQFHRNFNIPMLLHMSKLHNSKDC